MRPSPPQALAEHLLSNKKCQFPASRPRACFLLPILIRELNLGTISQHLKPGSLEGTTEVHRADPSSFPKSGIRASEGDRLDTVLDARTAKDPKGGGSDRAVAVAFGFVGSEWSVETRTETTLRSIRCCPIEGRTLRCILPLQTHLLVGWARRFWTWKMRFGGLVAHICVGSVGFFVIRRCGGYWLWGCRQSVERPNLSAPRVARSDQLYVAQDDGLSSPGREISITPSPATTATCEHISNGGKRMRVGVRICFGRAVNKLPNNPWGD